MSNYIVDAHMWLYVDSTDTGVQKAFDSRFPSSLKRKWLSIILPEDANDPLGSQLNTVLQADALQYVQLDHSGALSCKASFVIGIPSGWTTGPGGNHEDDQGMLWSATSGGTYAGWECHSATGPETGYVYVQVEWTRYVNPHST